MSAKKRRAAEVKRLFELGQLAVPRRPFMRFDQLAGALGLTKEELEHVGPHGAGDPARARREGEGALMADQESRDAHVTVFVCGRPNGPRAACSRPGCVRGADRACSYPVTRKGVTGTCGAALCDRCARAGADGPVICPPHAGLLARKAAAGK